MFSPNEEIIPQALRNYRPKYALKVFVPQSAAQQNLWKQRRKALCAYRQLLEKINRLAGLARRICDTLV